MSYAAKPWLARYPAPVPPALEYPPVPLPAFLERAAAAFGDRTCTVFFGSRLTFRAVHEQARRLAGGLAALGVSRGTRVAIMLPNSPQAVVAYYAVLLLGGVVVMVNPLYTPRELQHQLDDARATHLIALDLLWPTVAQVRAGTALEHIVVTGLQEYMPWPVRWGYLFKVRKRRVPIPYGGGVHRWQQVLAAPPVTAPSPAGPGDIALLQYTGGTTGLSKGCMLTHRNLVSNCVQIAAWLYQAQDGQGTTIAALPFFHVYGMTSVMNFCVYKGQTMVLVPRFEPGEILKLIQKYRPNIFPGAPTMYIALLNHPRIKEYDLSSIEACISGAAPLPREVQDEWEKVTGGRMVEGYGLSEASPVTHCNPVWEERRAGSIGLPWPDTEAMVVDPDTEVAVPVGEPGELLIRGPQVMSGYWQRPEENEVVLRGGWLHTGDIAVMDPDGYFRIVDRKKDVIIASGYKVFPREVEELLYAHPDVQEACVVGIPDPYRGETVKAFVTLRPGRQAGADALERYLRANLAAYKVPRLYEFRASLPKSLVGKVLRRVLRDEELAKQAPPAEK